MVSAPGGASASPPGRHPRDSGLTTWGSEPLADGRDTGEAQANSTGERVSSPAHAGHGSLDGCGCFADGGSPTTTESPRGIHLPPGLAPWRLTRCGGGDTDRKNSTSALGSTEDLPQGRGRVVLPVNSTDLQEERDERAHFEAGLPGPRSS